MVFTRGSILKVEVRMRLGRSWLRQAVNPQEAVAVLKVSLSVLFAFSLLDPASPAQTNLNDIHVPPRAMSPPSANAVDSIELFGGSGPHVIKTDVKLVLVPVSVTDSTQRLVTGLRAENFQVYEGKKPQEIRHFSSEDVPVSIGIILDASGSMGDKVNRVREAVNQF
jgi:Ca-activated chloride channel homolog